MRPEDEILTELNKRFNSFIKEGKRELSDAEQEKEVGWIRALRWVLELP